MAIFEKLRVFVIFKIYIEKRTLCWIETKLTWLRHRVKNPGQSGLPPHMSPSAHP
jgi:hypothetical protein